MNQHEDSTVDQGLPQQITNRTLDDQKTVRHEGSASAVPTHSTDGQPPSQAPIIIPKEDYEWMVLL